MSDGDATAREALKGEANAISFEKLDAIMAERAQREADLAAAARGGVIYKNCVDEPAPAAPGGVRVDEPPPAATKRSGRRKPPAVSSALPSRPPLGEEKALVAWLNEGGAATNNYVQFAVDQLVAEVLGPAADRFIELRAEVRELKAQLTELRAEIFELRTLQESQRVAGRGERGLTGPRGLARARWAPRPNRTARPQRRSRRSGPRHGAGRLEGRPGCLPRDRRVRRRKPNRAARAAAAVRAVFSRDRWLNLCWPLVTR